jgi:threonine dehydrogenase-like Zn-dependent dehydrogenase
MYNTKAYAASSNSSPLAATTIRRREPADKDVQLEILFCGVCHSDLHQVRNEWKDALPTVYPCMPGHEIVGHVGLDPKFETLRNRDNCSERRFGWQQPVFSKWSSELR